MAQNRRQWLKEAQCIQAKMVHLVERYLWTEKTAKRFLRRQYQLQTMPLDGFPETAHAVIQPRQQRGEAQPELARAPWKPEPQPGFKEWRMCGRKRTYNSPQHARQVARQYRQFVYQCPECNKWHLTSHKQGGLQNR